MNIILFSLEEVELPLPKNDPRARHIVGVLRRQVGDTFDAGIVNGPMGKGTVAAIEKDSLVLTFAWAKEPPPLPAIHLLIGLPRPQTARDILRDLTTLGVASMHFFRPEKGEASYAGSTLWKSDEWKNCVAFGAAQAFCTRLPEITHGRSLTEAIAGLPADASRFALDNYESPGPLSQSEVSPAKRVVLALGAERGWSSGERAQLRQTGFTLVHLGSRVLRTETACVVAVTLLRAKLGLL